MELALYEWPHSLNRRRRWYGSVPKVPRSVSNATRARYSPGAAIPDSPDCPSARHSGPGPASGPQTAVSAGHSNRRSTLLLASANKAIGQPLPRCAGPPPEIPREYHQPLPPAAKLASTRPHRPTPPALPKPWQFRKHSTVITADKTLYPPSCRPLSVKRMCLSVRALHDTTMRHVTECSLSAYLTRQHKPHPCKECNYPIRQVLARALAGQHEPHRQQHDLEVELERNILDIIEVVFKALASDGHYVLGV